MESSEAFNVNYKCESSLSLGAIALGDCRGKRQNEKKVPFTNLIGIPIPLSVADVFPDRFKTLSFVLRL